MTCDPSRLLESARGAGYDAAVYEFNGSGGAENYLTPGAPGRAFTPMTPPGYALQFNGSGSYVAAPNTTALNFPGAFTLEAWVYKASPLSLIHISEPTRPY